MRKNFWPKSEPFAPTTKRNLVAFSWPARNVTSSRALDYVIASIHAGFGSDEKDNTDRLIRAMENPHVTCLGHPTGRLLLEREPYPVNIPKVLEAAAATGTWIELNCNPWRLDLDWRWWRRARDLGILCCLNPDAHKTEHLGFLDLGVTVARKGWLRPSDLVNTRTLSQLRKLL